MKILKKIFIVFIVGAILSSCNNEWDDHYAVESGSDSGTNDNLYGYISADERYSEFKELIDEVGLSGLFIDKLEKTLFLPSNDVFDYDRNLDSLGKVALVTNYLVAGAKYSNTMNVPSIKAYNGKWLNLGVNGENRTINGAEFIYDSKVSNGLIYEIKANYSAVPNLFEYILALPNEYSKLRDYVISENDTVFVLEDSKPIGINGVGETMYDSVFIIENKFIAGANNVMIEERKYTMFLPSDEVVEKEINKVAAVYLAGVGEKLTENQLFNLEKWCLTSIFHRHLIDYVDFGEGDNVELTNGNLYKIAEGLQEIAENYIELSNGRCYDVKSVHVPKNLYMPTTRFDIWNVTSATHAAVNKYFSRGSFKEWGSYNTVKWVGSFNPVPLYEWPSGVEFETWRTLDGVVEDAIILPGEYDVQMSVCTGSVWSLYDRSGDFKIEIGSVLPEYKDERIIILEHPTYYGGGWGGGGPNDGFRNKDDGGNAGRFTIPEKYGNNKLKFYVTILKNNGRRTDIVEAYLSWVRFTPTTNNY